MISNSKIQGLSLKRFTAFEETHFEFSSGINVLIGTNSTGKTHMMKLMYSLLKTCETVRHKKFQNGSKFNESLYLKLEGVYRFIETVYDLIRAKYLVKGSQGLAPAWPVDFVLSLYIDKTSRGFYEDFYFITKIIL